MKYLNTKPGSIEEIAAKMQSNIKEDEYKKVFKKELDKAGKGIGGMSPKEKKDFFNNIDKNYKAKNEEDAYDKDDEKPKSKPKPKNEITAAQKKLPPALQKAIKAKEDKKESVDETHMSQTKKANNHQKSADGEKEIVKSEDLDSKDKPTVKDVIGQLKGAVKAHGKQANDLEKAMKTESEPKMKFKSFKEAMNTMGDSEHQKTKQQPEMKKSGKDKDVKTIKGNTDAGTKPTPIDTTPEIDFKN
jgi:hypothetical protein